MRRFLAAALFTLVLLSGQAFAAATLLPNGEQCFSASAATSGGTLGPITALGTVSGGASYVNGTYTNVPLTGGSGFGAKATVTVTAGAVSNVALTNPGSHYSSGDTLSAATTTIGGGAGAGFSVPVNTVSTTGTGMVGLIGTITGGAGGAAGSYPNVPLTGGAGSGATANITVAGGAVTAVTILNPGSQYVVGDTLSAASGNIGGVSGFSVPIASVTINNSLAGGQVGFYVPNTLTVKSTWFNPDQAANHLNPNPVPLDANGCAVIYGAGTYRQILQDSLGNTIWDQLTTDTSAGASTFWAGVAAGTPNVITITDPGFNGTDGSIIGFTALATNTSSVTINPSSFGAIPVFKDTTGGPASLVGGEIVQQNPISVIFRASDNAFHLLNPPIQSASGATAPLCGAVGLKITNSVSSPSTLLTLSAAQIVMQTTSGITINRSNISLGSINISIGTTVTTANGMDGEAPGTSAWLYIWAIDNGAGTSGLVSAASGNGLSPTLPSGYTYKCRLGAMRVDGSGNLMRTLQLGPRAQYQITAGSNTIAYPTMASGSNAGAFISIGAFVPATAPEISLAAASTGNSTSAQINVGPSNANNAAAAFFLLRNDSASLIHFNTPFSMILEASTVFYSSTDANASLLATGWKDAVNAN